MRLDSAAQDVARRTGVDRDVSLAVVEAFLGLLVDELSAGTAVVIRNFGTFKPVRRSGGVSADKIDDRANTVNFTAAAALKKAIRAPR